MSVAIFLSAVSDEFSLYHEQLRSDLTRQNVEVKVQEDFKALGGDTLDKLDVYINNCDAVVHLVGDMTGSNPGEPERMHCSVNIQTLRINFRRSARRWSTAVLFPIRNGRRGSRFITTSSC